jgi:hypothetical protein
MADLINRKLARGACVAYPAVDSIRQADRHSCGTEALVMLKDALRDPRYLSDDPAVMEQVSHGRPFVPPSRLLRGVQRSSYLREAGVDPDGNVPGKHQSAGSDTSRTLREHLAEHRTAAGTVAASGPAI